MSQPSAGGLLAAQWGLPRLGARPPLRQYLERLWERRYFTVELARSRFRAENEQDRLGIAWVVLRPLINAAVYGTIFGILLKGSASRPQPFVPYLVIGVFIFQYFSVCMSAGAKSIVTNMGLVRTLHFPRAVLPISKVLQQTMALGPMVLVMCVACLIFGVPLRWQWITMLPALVLMFFFCNGVAMMAARLTIHVRDITNLIPFITRLLFYISGVFFEVDKLYAAPEWVKVVLTYNPTHVYIALVRDALLVRDHADWTMWLAAVVWAVLFLVAGFLYFWSAEERYGRP